MKIMKKIVKNFRVSSADWEVEVDDINEKSAAVSALILLLNKLGGNLLLSTTIMVNESYHNINDVMNANFFSTSSILRKIGHLELSETLSTLFKQ
jgi:hypothetical protein